jgi:two-component system chemotaxis response regulator CheB
VTSGSPRVLVCEDSQLFAHALQRLLEHDGDIHVAGVYRTAEEAIGAVKRLQPDLVTMDIELPGMTGLEAVEQIMSSNPTPILVLSSHVGNRHTEAAAALAAGALEALGKEDVALREPAGPAGVAFRRRIRILSNAKVIRHPRARLQAHRNGTGSGVVPHPHAASVIGIASSTGGPQVLKHLLEKLPPGFPIPVLVVQHIAPGFTDSLATWLDRAVELPVHVATEGAIADRGVWIAPEGMHLRLARDGRLTLDETDHPGPHRPSGDVLLDSIATSAGRTGVAVVLSGMGRDGANGAAAVKRAGGLAIAQDAESCAVYGMPKAAVEQGVDVILTPDDIVASLKALRHEPLGVVA